MKLLKLIFGLFWASAVCLPAAPLQREYVPTNAIWFTHLDVDRLKQTKLGQYALQRLQDPEAAQKIDYIKATYNFDVTKDLHGVTVYGQDKKSENCVLLAFGDMDTARFLTVLKTNKGYEVKQIGKHKVYSWIDAKDPKKPRTGVAVIPGGLAFSANPEKAAAALDAIQGKQPGTKTVAAFGELGLTVRSPFLIGAARPEALPTSSVVALLLKSITLVAWGVGENDGQMEAEFPVTSRNPQAAQQLLGADKGLAALLALQANDPVVSKIVSGLSTKAAGPVVSTTLKLPVADVLQIVEGSQAQTK